MSAPRDTRLSVQFSTTILLLLASVSCGGESEQEGLVGTWVSAGEVMEFFEGGTITFTTRTRNGDYDTKTYDYQLLNDSTFRLDRAALGGSTTFRFDIEAHTLHMRHPDGDQYEYERFKLPSAKLVGTWVLESGVASRPDSDETVDIMESMPAEASALSWAIGEDGRTSVSFGTADTFPGFAWDRGKRLYMQDLAGLSEGTYDLKKGILRITDEADEWDFDGDGTLEPAVTVAEWRRE